MPNQFATGAAIGRAQTLVRAHSKSALNRRLLVGASTVVMAALLPSLAGAQALPAGCDPATATAASTVNCVVAPPATLDPVTTNVDDLTLNIGNASTPTSIESTSTAVFMTGATSLTLNIFNAGSSVSGTDASAAGVFMNMTGGSGNLTLSSEGSISGGQTGADLRNYGSGALSVNVANASGSGANGIFAFNSGAGTDLSITSTGLLSGNFNAVNAQNHGTGALTINVVDTYSAVDFAAIYANNHGTDLTVTSTGTVDGAGAGIYLLHSGSGVLTIDAGAVTGRTASGIYARTYSGSGVSITTTGPVNGAFAGVSTRNYGTGDMVINVTDVTAGLNPAIFAVNHGDNLSITSTGTLTGGSSGVSVFNLGSGSLDVDVVDVTGGASGAIAATNFAGSTDMSIRSSGTITGGGHGIRATNNGTGALTLSLVDVAGANGHGIWATNNATGTDLTITSTGLVTGSSDGIRAEQYGSGALAISVHDVTGGSDGIYAINTGTDLTLAATGTVAGQVAIGVSHAGTGSARITANDTSGDFAGISASTGSSAIDLSITSTGTASGGQTGIGANHYGSGALNIVAFDAAGGTLDGIRAKNGGPISAGTDLSIALTGTASGGRNGILAENLGSGALTIHAVDASGDLENGIAATNSAAGTDLSIVSTGAVAGGMTGINATNSGSGALTISAADSTGANSGIFANNSGAGTNLSVSVSGTASGATGVDARNYGSGSLSVAAVNVSGSGSSGIFANNSVAGVNLSIASTGLVTGATDGISALNSGSGALTVNATNATGAASNGIFASNSGAGTDLSIASTGLLSGNFNAVNAQNHGTGALTINVADTYSAVNFAGIYAHNEGTDLSITSTGTVDGAGAGIYLSQAGSGATTVNAVDVNARANSGIYAFVGSGSGVSITSTGTVTGAFAGIAVRNYGGGDLTIDTASVSGAVNPGIFAANRGEALSITSSGPVSGGSTGISAFNLGTGALALDVADVTGAGANGINASNSSAGTDLTIASSGTITGATNGINAVNSGSGALTVYTVNAAGASGAGISAVNSADGTDLSITATGNVTGSLTGIYARNDGTGSTTIDVPAGTAVGSASAGAAMGVQSALMQAAESGTTAVSGSDYGIVAIQNGDGTVQINVAGVIEGGNAGIVTSSRQGSSITVSAGGSVGSTSGLAIQTGAAADSAADNVAVAGVVNGMINMGGGNDTVALIAGSAVNGAVMLGDGDDTLNYSGGTIGAVRGGEGNDTGNFSGAGVTINNSGGENDVFAGFAAFNFTEGNYVLTGLHQGLSETSFTGGVHVLAGTLVSDEVAIASGSGLQVGNGTTIRGDVTNAGALGLNADGFGTFTIDGDFTQTDTGILTLDLGASGAGDQLRITGAADLGGELAINRTDFNVDPVDLIVADGGFNGQFAQVTGLADTDLLASQTITFGPNGMQLVTQYADASALPGLTANQASLANALTGDLADSAGESAFRTFGLSVATLASAEDLIGALDQLSPELIDAGLQVAQSGQLRFVTQLLDQAGSVTAPAATLQVASLGDGGQAWPRRETGRIWASLNLTGSEQNNGGTNLEFEADGYDLTVGTAGMKAGPVSFGLAAGFAEYQTDIAGPDADQVTTDLIRLGAFTGLGLNQGGRGLNAHVDAAVSLAAGSNDFQRHIVIPAIGMNTIQSSDVGFTLANVAARLTVDGMNGQDWIVSPFLLVMSETLNQYADNIGRGQSTALAYGSVHQQRYTFGYGIDFDRKLTPQTRAEFRGAVLHHSGDTENTIVARFSAAGAAGSDPFVTVGRNIQTQYVLEGGLSHEFRSSMTASVHGFAELGDLESRGLRLRVARTF